MGTQWDTCELIFGLNRKESLPILHYHNPGVDPLPPEPAIL